MIFAQETRVTMNKLKGSLAAKVIAIILLAMSCLVICGVLVGVTWLDSEGAYRDKTIENVLCLGQFLPGGY